MLQLIAELRYSISVSIHVSSEDWLAAAKKLPFGKRVDPAWLSDFQGHVNQPSCRHPADIDISFHAHRFSWSSCPVSAPLVCIRRTIFSDAEPPTHAQDFAFLPLVRIGQYVQHRWDTLQGHISYTPEATRGIAWVVTLRETPIDINVYFFCRNPCSILSFVLLFPRTIYMNNLSHLLATNINQHNKLDMHYWVNLYRQQDYFMRHILDQ